MLIDPIEQQNQVAKKKAEVEDRDWKDVVQEDYDREIPDTEDEGEVAAQMQAPSLNKQTVDQHTTRNG